MGLASRGKGPGQDVGCPAKSAEPARNIEWQSPSVKIKSLKLLIFSPDGAWPGACFQRLEPFLRPGDPMEFSSSATQRSSASSESLVIQPGSARNPAVDAANDFARHLAENSRLRSDRRDDRPTERRERSAAPERQDESSARKAAREDRDRESKKVGTGESSSIETAPASDAGIDLPAEAMPEDMAVATEDAVEAGESEQVAAENEADKAEGDESADAIAATAVPTTDTAATKTLEKGTSPAAPVAIKGTSNAASQQAAAPAGMENTEGQVAPASQPGEETASATDAGKTQSRAASQVPSQAQNISQASPAYDTAKEQLAAADAEAAETKPQKTAKGLGQEAAEKLAERKSGDHQTASQVSAAASPATGQATVRSVTSAAQIAPGTSVNTGASANSGDMPISTVQQSANAGGNAATIRIGTLPGQSQPTQLPANTIALQMARNLQKGTNRFDIRLDPPEMGRIDVRMEVRKDGHVAAHMTVDRPETLDLLQRDARALQQALNNAGLHADNDSLNFSLRDQNDNGGERDFAGGGNSAAASGEADAETPLAPIYNINLATNGGVDIRI